jgi:hypothetical protein
MATITIHESSVPYCLWCDSTSPATKAGWIEYRLSLNLKVHFCSKKCLASATFKGRGVVLDFRKLAVRQRQKDRADVKTRFKEILEKDRMDIKDFPVFFLAMSAKQKKALACIGLSSLLGRFYRNPKKILTELDWIQK